MYRLNKQAALFKGGVAFNDTWAAICSEINSA
jgi:hypothetical protein